MSEKAKNLRKNLTGKLKARKSEKIDENKANIILPPTSDPNAKKKDEDIDPLAFQLNTNKKEDDPLALLGILEDKKKEKEKQNEKLGAMNNFNIPKSENTSNTFQNSNAKNPLLNRLKKNKEENAYGLKSSVNKQNEEKIVIGKPLVIPASLGIVNGEKVETKEEEKKEENVPKKFGLPEMDKNKKSRFMTRLKESKGNLKKSEFAQKIFSTSEAIVGKAKELEKVIGPGKTTFENLEDVQQVKEGAADPSKVGTKHINLENFMKK